MESSQPKPGRTYEFLGLRSEEPLTLESLNRLLIREVVQLRWKLECLKDNSEEETTEEILREQLHEARIQTKVAEKQKQAADESAEKWMGKYAKEHEEKELAELLRIEEKNHYEEHLRLILTNSKEMAMQAEKEIQDLSKRCSSAEECVKQLQKEVANVQDNNPMLHGTEQSSVPAGASSVRKWNSIAGAAYEPNSLADTEHNSQIVRLLGQISKLQRDKQNLERKRGSLKDQARILKSKAKYLESERIKASGLADLMKREKSKTEAKSEALQLIVRDLEEKLEESKISNQVTSDKLFLYREKNEKDEEQIADLQLQLTDLKDQLAHKNESSRMSSSPICQGSGANRPPGFADDKMVQVGEPTNLMMSARCTDAFIAGGNGHELAATIGWSDFGADRAVSGKSMQELDAGGFEKEISTCQDEGLSMSVQARALEEKVSLLQSELQMEGSSICSHHEGMLDLYRNKQEQELNTGGANDEPYLASENTAFRPDDNPTQLSADAPFQNVQKVEMKFMKVPESRGSCTMVSKVCGLRNAAAQTSFDGSSSHRLNASDLKGIHVEGPFLSEFESVLSSIGDSSEREHYLLARLAELTAECRDLKKECQRLNHVKEQQNEEWIKNVSNIEACHREQMSAAVNAVRYELDEAILAHEAAQTECERLNEQRGKSLRLMSQARSEKDELQAALDVCGMAQKNMEESQEYNRVLKIDLTAANRALADVRKENIGLHEKVGNLEEACKISKETHENLTRELKARHEEHIELEKLREENNELKNQILAGSNASGERQGATNGESLLSEDISNRGFDKLTAKVYSESIEMIDQERAKIYEELLRKKDEEHESKMKSLISQGEAAMLLYEENIHELIQENCQLAEQNRQNHKKNETRSAEARLYSRVDSLDGNEDFMTRSTSSINSSLAVIRVFNSLRDRVKNGRMNTREAWDHLEAAAVSNKKKSSFGKEGLSQDVDGVDEIPWNLQVQLGWLDPTLGSCVRTDAVEYRPPSSCASGGDYARSEGSGTGPPGPTCSSSRRSPLNSDPGSGGSSRSKDKKIPKKSIKPTGAGRVWRS